MRRACSKSSELGSASGSITLSKAQAKAVLPASVMRSIGTRLGSDIVQCDPMRLTVAMNALTLPVDATGALQPFAAGSDIDFTVHLDPWKVQARQSPTLAFGANDLVVKLREEIARKMGFEATGHRFQIMARRKGD